MALTTAQAMTLPGMEMRLLAGRAGLARVVRWAHVSELADPVPWLRGGELVMTIGLGLPADGEGRRAYVERLSGAGCAALAFALGEAVTEVPGDVLAAADACGLPVLEILTPFIAVSEAVARWHADERVRGERRVVAAQEAMARAALVSGTSGILRALAEHAGGEVLLLDPHGGPRASVPPGERPWHARAVEAAGSTARRSAGVMDDGIEAVQVQSLGFSGPPTGWLAVRTASPLDWHVRMLTNHAVCLLAIELLGVRAGRARSHAQRAALLSAVLDGGLSTRQLGELCSVAAPPYEVVVAGPRVPVEAAVEALADVVADAEAEELAFVCPRPEGVLFVLPDDGRRRGEELCARLGAAGGGCRALSLDELPAAARHAAALAGRGDGYTHVDDLEAWALLRDAVDPEAARRFSGAVLRPLREYEARHGGHLVASVRAYLEAGENLEIAARRLGVHRNTLRRRLAAAERVSGRPLTDPGHRLQLWLAVSLGDLVPPGRVTGHPPE
ncbi:PucR family transcriptional regulator [Nonomuraea roseoviolacea]|uniref:Purine catabolism regulator n=1 Tax=Nonomuraea roseoviolacea subsp. carminata TaxID=160689 RepID=A0ABT1JV41_9ACTN|nr:PucR family transcriptional regulator [Nonomuraea roseoviolacea]MCP2345618.1 purine catabolism regulator [Nonomuraea roseoviolacea subsp. carminata]